MHLMNRVSYIVACTHLFTVPGVQTRNTYLFWVLIVESNCKRTDQNQFKSCRGLSQLGWSGARRFCCRNKIRLRCRGPSVESSSNHTRTSHSINDDNNESDVSKASASVCGQTKNANATQESVSFQFEMSTKLTDRSDSSPPTSALVVK